MKVSKRMLFVRALLLVVGSAMSVSASEGVKISERFGYDPVDSTRFVQAALDSDYPTVILDRQRGDWHVTPLKGRSDKKLVFEDGAYLVAKKGAFKGIGDKMFSFLRCTNVVFVGAGPDKCGIRMHRDDYADKTKYGKSEWRHAISLLSCGDVRIEGIGISETGGDGLYLGFRGTPCRDITVKRCIFDKNYRQGISVISVRNLLIEDTVIANTAGTLPAAGIDFEPNACNETLERIVMRNCTITNNQGKGVYFELERYDGRSPKVSARFLGCRISGNQMAFVLNQGKHRLDMPDDDCDFRFEDCTFENSRREGIYVSRRPLSSGRVEFVNCLVSSNCTDSLASPDVSLSAFPHYGFPPASYLLRDLTVLQQRRRNWLRYPKFSGSRQGSSTQMEANVRIVSPEGETGFVMNADRRKKNGRGGEKKAAAPMERGTTSLASATVVDEAPGRIVGCAPVLACARSFLMFPYYVFYADAPKTVHFGYVRNRGAKSVVLNVYRYNPSLTHRPNPGLVVASRTIKDDAPRGRLEFAVPEKGFYMLYVNTRMRGFGIDATDVPIALNVSKDARALVAPDGSGLPRDSVGRVFFNVSGAPFHANVVGDGSSHYIGCRILGPSGECLADEPVFSGARHFRFEKPEAGLWTLEVGRPKSGWYEYYSLGLSGVPGWYFLCKEKYWTVNRR